MLKIKENKGKITKVMIIGIIVIIVVIAILAYLLISRANKPSGWNDNVSVITTDEGIKIPLPKGFKQ